VPPSLIERKQIENVVNPNYIQDLTRERACPSQQKRKAIKKADMGFLPYPPTQGIRVSKLPKDKT
jgi:hypothetical protein